MLCHLLQVQLLAVHLHLCLVLLLRLCRVTPAPPGVAGGSVSGIVTGDSVSGPVTGSVVDILAVLCLHLWLSGALQCFLETRSFVHIVGTQQQHRQSSGRVEKGTAFVAVEWFNLPPLP